MRKSSIVQFCLFVISFLGAIVSATAQENSHPLAGLSGEQLCQQGCMVEFQIDRIPEDQVFAGEFESIAHNPLKFVVRVHAHDFPVILFRLSNEAGSPMFMSIAQLIEYMEVENEQIRSAAAALARAKAEDQTAANAK